MSNTTDMVSEAMNAENVEMVEQVEQSEKVEQVEKVETKVGNSKIVKPRPPTRADIIKKYKGKMCSMSRAYPCTIHMCALSKCYRVQDLENAGMPVKTPVKPVDSMRAIAALERKFKK